MNDELSATKKALRLEMRHKRTALPEAQRAAASSTICTRVLALLEQRERVRIALYLAQEFEPNLDVLIGDLKKHRREVHAPHFQDAAKPFYTLAQGGENIETVKYQNTTLRVPREYSGGVARSPDELDVILIPALAFDLAGNRLGQGGGWYDRVLARAPNALKIGVCFDFQIVESVPRQSHDIAMNFIVTEKRLLKF